MAVFVWTIASPHGPRSSTATSHGLLQNSASSVEPAMRPTGVEIYRPAKNKLKRGIRAAKERHAEKLKDRISANNSSSVWKVQVRQTKA